MKKTLSVNIIILNYEGRNLLEENLPGIVEAAQKSSFPCHVTVLDNCSQDQSLEFVKAHYPEVAAIRAPENKVLCSYNDLAKTLKEDILILLNNDVKVAPDFVDPLIAVFEKHEDAFFVSTYGDCAKARIRRGTLTADNEYSAYRSVRERFSYTINTGMGAFDRRKFLELEGYDSIYLPGRYEDMDLCYRGWKRGWKGYCQPTSRIRHEGGVSFNKYFTSDAVQRLVLRNSILFMIKNVTDPFLFLRFMVFLFLRLIFFVATGKRHMLLGIKDAVAQCGAAVASRKRVRSQFKLKDREIIRLINQTYPAEGSDSPLSGYQGRMGKMPLAHSIKTKLVILWFCSPTLMPLGYNVFKFFFYRFTGVSLYQQQNPAAPYWESKILSTLGLLSLFGLALYLLKEEIKSAKLPAIHDSSFRDKQGQ